MPLRSRVVLITVGSVMAVIALLIFGLVAYDKLTEAPIITDALREHLTHPEFFSTKNLTSHEVDGPFNLNGDESLYGDYRLNKADMLAFLAHKPLFNCGTTRNDCTITDRQVQENGRYCEDAHKNGHDVSYGICVDEAEGTVYWEYYFY